MTQVKLEQVSKSWETATAVDGIDLLMDDKEFVAILGPSGCGKSTLLFMLAGIYRPTSGNILFDGEIVNEVEARYRNVGIVFQSYALYPHMNVLQNIMFPLRFQDKKNKKESAREMADLVQVSELLDRKPAQLSGGQQQRVALARALVKKPKLLLLDEPLSNLDATLRLTMRAEIRRITQELSVTTLLVTHDQLEATTMADRIVCMKAGKVEQMGKADELYLRPDTLFVAGFIGSPPINLISCPQVEMSSKANTSKLAVANLCPTDEPFTIGIRPEMLSVSESGFAATVLHTEPMGREVLTTVSSDLGNLRFLESTSSPRWTVKEQIKLSFNTKNAVVFSNTGQRISDAQVTLEV